MEEKNVTKISLSTLFLIFAIIAIIVMGIFIYKLNSDKTAEIQKSTELQAQVNSLNGTVSDLQGKINSTSQTIENKSTTSEISKDEINNNKIETLDIKSDSVKKLYNYVSKFSYYDELIAYQSKKVTEKDLANSLKLLTVFNNLDKDDATRIEYQYENEYIPKREHIIYSKKIIDDKATEIFGNNVTIIHENASPYDGHSIIYKNNEYDSFDYEGGGVVPWESSTSKLIKAEQIGDDIFIYDKYVHLVEVENIVNGINHAGSYDIYSASDKNVKLSSKVDFDKNKLYGDDIIGNIEKFLNQELTTFKHTFKKSSNGSYYWYSSEPINK